MGMKLQVVRLPALRRGRRRGAAAGDEPRRRRRVGRSVGPSVRRAARLLPAACPSFVLSSVRYCDIMRSLAGAMEFVRGG